MTYILAAILVVLILLCLLLTIIVCLCSELVREMKNFRFQFVDQMMSAVSNKSFLHEISDNIEVISVNVDEIRERQNRGPWEPSEPS